MSAPFTSRLVLARVVPTRLVGTAVPASVVGTTAVAGVVPTRFVGTVQLPGGHLFLLPAPSTL